MRQIIAIGGQPGSGKTTLMREFMKSYSWENVEPKKTVSGMYCKELDLYVLGKYEEGEVFAGTDRLSMAVQPNATEWIKETNSNVIYEGDRIFNQSFLEVLINLASTEVNIVYLKVDKETLNKRYIERGSNQPEKFLKSRETKLNNILSNFELMSYITEFKNETYDDQKKVIDFISDLLKRGN